MSLVAKILSLNIGEPAPMEWEGRSVVSSMLKHPVPGPLVVHEDRIEGNKFAQPQYHGAIHSVLYALGIPSAEAFLKQLGVPGPYRPGTVGETLTLDAFDETDVSVGDIFEIGEVHAQATYPRIPCGKVDFRMHDKMGRRAMVACGRSGVYFRILKPGIIRATDAVHRIERAEHPFTIHRLYELESAQAKPTDQDIAQARANPAFLKEVIQEWEQA